MYLFLLHESPVPHVHNPTLDAWLTAINLGALLLAVALIRYLFFRRRTRFANHAPRNRASS